MGLWRRLNQESSLTVTFLLPKAQTRGDPSCRLSILQSFLGHWDCGTEAVSEVAVPDVSGVWTDAQGTILDISEEAARLLARTRRTLLGKSMLLFVGGNRDHVLLAVERASRGHGETFEAELMPVVVSAGSAFAYIWSSQAQTLLTPKFCGLLGSYERGLVALDRVAPASPPPPSAQSFVRRDMATVHLVRSATRGTRECAAPPTAPPVGARSPSVGRSILGEQGDELRCLQRSSEGPPHRSCGLPDERPS